MADVDIVTDLARGALTVPAPGGNSDSSLWDRAQRLARNVELICRIPQLRRIETQIDHFSLMAATYFSDAGLAQYLKSAKTGPEPMALSVNGGDLLDLCTETVDRALGAHIDQVRVNNINRIITESQGYSARMTEAMILSDARNLDDMGAVGIFNEFRRYFIGGKGVSDAVQLWKKKIDYRYWQSRLKEGFQFDPVRRIAERRLAAAESFMNELKVENSAVDFEEFIAELAEKNETSNTEFEENIKQGAGQI